MFDALFKERFEEKYIPEPNSGCWLWIGSSDGRYGEIQTEKKVKKKAHIASWEFSNNAKFPKGLLACHKCDVTFCVNPDHIFPGTQVDNLNDCYAKGRHPMANLTHCKRGHPLSGDNVYVRRNGKWRQCKACRKETRQKKSSYFVGTKFGHLTILEKARSRSWLVKCDCGEEFVASAVSLHNGTLQSCGCIRALPTEVKNAD